MDGHHSISSALLRLPHHQLPAAESRYRRPVCRESDNGRIPLTAFTCCD